MAVTTVTYGPKTLENVQVNIVLGELIVDTEIGIWSCEEGGIRRD